MHRGDRIVLMKILFVCTSNIMRSPYCEFVFGNMVENDPMLKDKVEWVKSAALRWRYRHMHKKSQNALIKEGFSEDKVKDYRPRHVLIDKDLFDSADIIIGMTASHRKMLPKKYRYKFTTLTEAVLGQYKEIKDPYWERLSQDEYNQRMDEIKAYLEQYAESLKN